MPIIKKIKILKSKVTISFLDHEKIEIDREVYPNFYLYEGKDVSKKELNQIISFNQSIYLWNYALKLRQKHLYSEYAMREKLYEKGGKKDEADEVIKRLKRNDLIDDNAFIMDYIEYYNSLLYGKNKIITKLSDKGIFKEKLEKINFNKSVEIKKAKTLLPRYEKKYSKFNNQEKKRHIYQAYISNGYDIDIASMMVELIKDNTAKEENDKLKKDFDKAYQRLSKKYQKKELKQKLLAYLASKGYKMGDIINMMERSKL